MNVEHILAAVSPTPDGYIDGIDDESARALEDAGFIRLASSQVYKLTRHGWRRRAELDVARGSFTGAPRGGSGSRIES